jgi:4-hydroxyphenylpyruvate dioxygenase
MASREPIGIKRIEALHYYVHDLARSRRFYGDLMDFDEVAVSDDTLTRAGRQRSAAFRAGDCTIVCSEPVGEGGRAWRFLHKHPDGVGAIVFEVEDAERAFRVLESRGGTPIDDIQRHRDEGGTLATFSITTPFGDTTFRFVERRGFQAVYPGAVPPPAARPPRRNVFGFTRFDHVTSNFQTLAPALLWMEHVLGLERFWNVQFHTDDVAHHDDHGSGLRSVVMLDRASGVKFANNEPLRPHFKSSQINVFNEQHRGDGVQHAALVVRDIVGAVRGMRERGISFMPTPAAYYDALPERVERLGVGKLDEDLGTLRDLEILVDGDGPRQYLLQIFLVDAAALYHEPKAGPFFFEIIQRKGNQGFGEGNFRALFESIERTQKSEGGL